MAKKMSRISVNKLDGLLDETTTSVPLPGAPDVEVRIKRNLSLNEMLQFVEDVVSSCVDTDSGKYLPEIMWFSIYSAVLTMYANFTLPSSVEKQYDLIYNTDAVDLVMEHINKAQYQEIVDAIQKHIDHDRKMMESSLAEKMNNIVERMDSYIKESENLLGSVSGDDMSSLIKNLAAIGSLDEDKLIHALVESQRSIRANDNSIATADTPVKDGVVLTFPNKK